MTALERRYRWLLKLLPRAKAEEAGPELLGMWLDGASPQQQWPSLMQILDVCRLSLRARYEADTQTTPWRVVATSFVYAALVKVAFEIITIPVLWRLMDPPLSAPERGATTLPGLVLALIALCWPRRSALQVVGAVTAVATSVVVGVSESWTLAFLAAPALVLIRVGLVTPRSWRAAAIVAFLTPLIAIDEPYTRMKILDTLGTMFFLAIALSALVDPRASLAIVWLTVLSSIVHWPQSVSADPFMTSLTVVLALIGCLQISIRRRTQLVAKS